ncbi:DinB family protein [Streptomyces sp. NPDC049906]|uniref:DinB family protein n=1 Tax=Streptomyces sp. NPDC049906 TaxID=3155656 RepID=UPI003430A3CD
MTSTRIALLRWQSDLTWSLFEYHLDRLEEADFLAEPAASHVWTVRPAPDGTWVPDWADVEPDPVPVPTIGWLSWHLGWWWSTALDQVRGRVPRERTEVTWPGDGASTVAWLRGLHTEWNAALDALTDADLDVEVPGLSPEGPPCPRAQLLAWANAELMKNVAEIGRARLVRAAA